MPKGRARWSVIAYILLPFKVFTTTSTITTNVYSTQHPADGPHPTANNRCHLSSSQASPNRLRQALVPPSRRKRGKSGRSWSPTGKRPRISPLDLGPQPGRPDTSFATTGRADTHSPTTRPAPPLDPAHPHAAPDAVQFACGGGRVPADVERGRERAGEPAFGNGRVVAGDREA